MYNSYPLTPIQQTMYASAALTGRHWQYVEQIVVHIPADAIAADVIGQAWSDLYAAHPALRACIIGSNAGRPEQYVTTPVAIHPQQFDWQGQTQSDIDIKLRDFLAQDRVEGVDAAAAPAMRLTIIQTGSAQSILIWSFPHSLLDGRAFAPLLDEVFQRYAALKSGQATTEAAPDAHLFEQHCRQLATLDHGAGLTHFTQSLAGWEGSEGLLRQGASPTRKIEASFDLTQQQTDAMTTLARRADVSVSTVVMAAWGITLARFSGQSDVVFGNTRNGRYLVPGSADAPGCFITTVPMRVQLDPTTTIGDLLHNLRQEQIALRPFEHTPLTDISRALGLAPGRSLFDSTLMFDFGTLQEQLVSLNRDWQNRKVDLLEEGDTPVSVAAYMGETLHLVVEYDPDQVPHGPALAECLFNFLARLQDVTPDQVLGTLSMLGPQTTQQMFDLAGPDVTPSPDTSSCLARFETSAATDPDHIALMQPGGDPITYGALDQAADQLAGSLIAEGVQHGDTIGICMARSPAFVTAMLAIWKAGAAFVPMDPGYPQATLEIIAQDSAARLVLTDDTAPTLDAPLRDINDLTQTAGALPSRDQRDLDDLAYVIFTSGSTGRPKGVMIIHRSLAAHADAIVPLFGLEPTDRVLQFAALSFDVALEEIIPTLTRGATLVLRSEAMSQSVQECLNQIEAHDITVANLPTGFWVALTDVLDSLDAPFPARVRLMIVGGERVPLSVLKRWRARLPEVRWLNGYGPTETTITCTTHEASDKDLQGDTVPIGRPLSHARAWVLSKDGALVPSGVEGELFISGPALAKGYMGDPERTKKSFANAIFDPRIGRIYATGDRVMWRDGVLHYLGRMDRQIKLRGFRIEPGQIEAALEKQDIIDRAYVDVLTSPNGPQQLVAWYSATASAELPSPEEISATINAILPPQMHPLPVPVTTWPQTPGGKVDVARLPHPETPVSTAPDMGDLDGTLIEDAMQLFKDVLQSDNIGPQTSFFEAGGDSLSLLRLMPALQMAFDVELEATALYSDPTPQGVVRALIAQDPDPLVVIPIQPNGDQAPLYGVHVLGDNGSFFRPLSQVLGDQQPVFGLTVGLLSEKTPTTVPDIAKFYLHQIERHQPEGPLSLIAVSAGSYVTLELAQMLLKAGRDVHALILLDAEGPAGRPRIGKLGRAGVHIGEILTQGWPYIAKQMKERKEAQSQDQARQKIIQVANQNDDIKPNVIGNVDEFVAANMLAIETYQPKPYPRPLTIYRAGNDKFDSKEALRTGLGWSGIAAAGFDLTDVPGDHLGILDAPNVEVLGAQISRLLKARAG